MGQSHILKPLLKVNAILSIKDLSFDVSCSNSANDSIFDSLHKTSFEILLEIGADPSFPLTFK